MLKEREKQLEMKNTRLFAQAEKERRMHQESVERLNVLEEEERRAAKERSKKRKDVQKYQLAQVQLHAQQRSEELEGTFLYFFKNSGLKLL